MSTKSFGFELVTLPDIFSEHYFRVPDYQRSYSWEKQQVNDLLDDIQHLLTNKTGARHFTGTLVLSRPEGSATDEYHVVDGQQRLTTLSIFLYVLCDYLDKSERAEFLECYIRRGRRGSERAVLTLNAQVHGFYEEAIMTSGDVHDLPVTMNAHERLLQARALIKKWFAQQSARGCSAKTIRRTIESKLGFIVYAPKEDAEAGAMFEVINNRGKELSELEKVKNYLIYCSVKLEAGTLRKKINEGWSSVLMNLRKANKVSLSDEDSFLRYSLITKLKLSKSDSQYGYKMLKEKVDISSAVSDADKRSEAIGLIDSLLTFLRASSLWYARLYGRLHDGVPHKIIPVLDQLRAQARHASIMPLFLGLVSRLNSDPERLETLLKLLEIVNFRVYMARGMILRNDSYQAEIYYYAVRYYHGTLVDFVKKEHPEVDAKYLKTEEDALEYMLVWFGIEYAPDDAFKKSFVIRKEDQFDFFKWRGIRYFLMSYEAWLQPNKTIDIDKILRSRSQGKSSDYYSVEHLWAVKNRGNGDNDRSEDKYQKRRLGNFSLLELRVNIKGRDDNLEDKIVPYVEGSEIEPATELHQMRLVAKDFNRAIQSMQGRRRTLNYYHDLHDKLNCLREERYVDFAAEQWSLESFHGYVDHL